MKMALLSKFNNKHFLSLAGNGIMSVFSLVTMGMLYRAFSSSAEIGIWVFFQSTLVLVDTFRSGFITTAFIKFYAGSDEKRAAEVLGSTWFLASAITLALVAINLPAFFLFPYIHNEGLIFFIKWFGITYICSLPSFIGICVVQAEQRFDRLLYIRFVSQSLFIVGIAVLIFLNKANLQNIIFINLFSTSLTSLFTIIAGFCKVGTFYYRTTACIKELFLFGKFSVGTTLSSNLFRFSDTFIINFMLGPSALAVYNLGQRLMEIVEIPLRSFAATAMPSLSTAYNQNFRNEVIYITKKYIGMLTLALVPALLVALIFADVAIGLIGGGKYNGTQLGFEAANVFRLFMTFALLYPVDRFLALTLDVINKPNINFVKVLVMLAANILGDFGGIYLLHNIYGVAITTVIPTCIGAMVGFWALRKYFHFSFWDIYRVGYKELQTLIKLSWNKYLITKGG